jgi:hypothetical protein
VRGTDGCGAAVRTERRRHPGRHDGRAGRLAAHHGHCHPCSPLRHKCAAANARNCRPLLQLGKLMQLPAHAHHKQHPQTALAKLNADESSIQHGPAESHCTMGQMDDMRLSNRLQARASGW